MRRIIPYLVILLVFAVPMMGVGTASGDDMPQWQSRADAEARALDLDQRAVELQHQVRAARQQGDQEGLQRAEADLKNVQAERVNAWRVLGELR